MLKFKWITFICALALVVSGSFSSIVWATIFWIEPFNNFSNWDHTPSNPTISACPSGFGSGTCYRGTYVGPDSGDFVDRTFSPVSELWVRFFYRVDNFSFNAVGTKVFYMASQNSATPYPNFVLEHIFGSRELSLIGQVVAENCGTGGYDTCNYLPNVKSIPIQDGQSYCVEVYVRYNTPGAADGQIQIFVNGTQTLNYANRVFRGASPSGPNGNSANAKIDVLREYVQHGNGVMWHDDLAVGNTRIGCTGAPNTDTTPPAVPTGLTLR